jgi:hypothetical protein
MNITTVPFAVLRFQYQLARLPLQLIEDRVVVKMGAESPARLFYERSLGMLDATVGHALGDAALAKRGSALAERSDALGRAARLDAAATQKEEKADAELQAKRDKVIEDQEEAREAKQSGIEEARQQAEQRKQDVQEAAAKRTATAKKQVDDVAAQRKNSIDEAKSGAQDRIRAAERRSAASAKAKLDDAQAKQNEAKTRRAQADRIEQLADGEKEKRQAARASKS